MHFPSVIAALEASVVALTRRMASALAVAAAWTAPEQFAWTAASAALVVLAFEAWLLLAVRSELRDGSSSRGNLTYPDLGSALVPRLWLDSAVT